MDQEFSEGCDESRSRLHPCRQLSLSRLPTCVRVNTNISNTNLIILLAYQQVVRPHKFFRPGRCFSAIWIEASGPPSLRDDVKHVTKVDFDQYAYTKPSRFISIRNKEGFCIALRIHTFGGRGEEKYHDRPKYLFFAHCGDDGADILQLESNVVSIKIEEPSITFTAGKSVILASKPYSVEHFLPVRNIGYVLKPSLAMLESAFIESILKDSMQSKLSFKPLTATTKKAIGCAEPGSQERQRLGQPANDFSLQDPRDKNESQILGAVDNNLFGHKRSDSTALLHGVKVDEEDHFCDWDPCPRKGQSFHRIEHLRDHLRDYHLEDIPRNRKFGKESKQVEWFTSRKLDKDWWRCKGCLGRVFNSEHRWFCPRCRHTCEQERIENRMQRYPGYYDEALVPHTSLDSGTSLAERQMGASPEEFGN
jgi:hypothetical protein